MRILVLALCVLLVVDASFVKEALEKKILKELLLRKLRDEINTDTGDDTAGGQEQQQQQQEQQQQQQEQQQEEADTAGGGGEEAELSLVEQIHAQEAKYMLYFKEQDYASLANLYTDDAYYYAPGEEAVHGKAQIEQNVWVPGSGGGEDNEEVLSFKSENVIEAGDDYAIGHGEWHVSHNEEVSDKCGMIADGHYLTVYRKVDGEWLIEMDIINMVHLYEEESGDEDDAPEDNGDEAASDDAENEVTKKRLVNVLKKILKLKKKETKTTPGVLHRRGRKSDGTRLFK